MPADAAISVTLTLHGELRARHADLDPVHPLALPVRATVLDALQAIGHVEEAWLVSVNGSVARRGRPLHDHDHLDVFPFLEGG